MLLNMHQCQEKFSAVSCATVVGEPYQLLWWTSVLYRCNHRFCGSRGCTATTDTATSVTLPSTTHTVSYYYPSFRKALLAMP